MRSKNDLDFIHEGHWTWCAMLWSHFEGEGPMDVIRSPLASLL